jgi:hypothetical protein
MFVFPDFIANSIACMTNSFGTLITVSSGVDFTRGAGFTRGVGFTRGAETTFISEREQMLAFVS